MKQIRVHQFKYGKQHQFVTDPVSMAVPDQCLTIQEMLYKHTMGTLGNVQRKPVYLNEDFDAENPLTKPDLDLTDIDESREKVESIKKRIQSQKKLKNNDGIKVEAKGSNDEEDSTKKEDEK